MPALLQVWAELGSGWRQQGCAAARGAFWTWPCACSPPAPRCLCSLHGHQRDWNIHQLASWVLVGEMYVPGGGFPGDSVVKNSPGKQERQVQSLGQKDPLEEEMATHLGIVAWSIPWTEEPDGLQSMGSQESWT